MLTNHPCVHRDLDCMPATSKIYIGQDTYIVGKAKKSAVNIQHDVFIPENTQKRPWKIFKRKADESDAALQKRILDDIDRLSKVCFVLASNHLVFLCGSRQRRVYESSCVSVWLTPASCVPCLLADVPRVCTAAAAAGAAAAAAAAERQARARQGAGGL